MEDMSESSLSSTAKGTAFESKIFDLLAVELREGRLGYDPGCCTIHHQKRYWSPKRDSDITFDITIEMRRPGSSDLAALLVFECKNYQRPVSIDAVESLQARLEQVDGVRARGIFVTRNSLQAGARNYARAQGIGLIRYLDNGAIKWEFQRSPSAGLRSDAEPDRVLIEKALSRENFASPNFDVFGEMRHYMTNSLLGLMHLMLDSFEGSPSLVEIRVAPPREPDLVPFVGKDVIENAAADVLSRVGERGQIVSLSTICESEKGANGLVVVHMDRPDGLSSSVLGSIAFDPLEIRIFEHHLGDVARYRFTLAHELGHYFMDHGRFIRSELCEVEDIEEESSTTLGASDIARLEWQANFFASCLLMPRIEFEHAVASEILSEGLLDRGFGLIYLDKQPCNWMAFSRVTARLALKFGVSRTAVRLRLVSLGIVVDESRSIARTAQVISLRKVLMER